MWRCVWAAIVGLVIYLQFADRRGFGEIIGKINSRFGNDHPTIMSAALGVLSTLGLPTRKAPQEFKLPPFPGPQDWPLHGVIPMGLALQRYDDLGVPIQSRMIEGDGGDPAATTEVSDTKSLIAALKRAKAGDTITLLPGTYVIHGRRVSLAQDGLPSMPIIVRARQFGEVTVELDTLEGFFVDKSHWVFENLRIKGICNDDSRCEHAFHVFGTATGSRQKQRNRGFNAAVKVNGVRRKGSEKFPDFGLVQNNDHLQHAPQGYGQPHDPAKHQFGQRLGGQRKLHCGLFKGRGNRISYAAFMKGNSEGGMFERNLVVCHWSLPVDGDIRLGLSLGGGGTGDRFCRRGDCKTEHTGGIIRNNIIARCPADVGIYLNRAAHTQIYSNLLVANAGIDVRFRPVRRRFTTTSSAAESSTGMAGTHHGQQPVASECGLFRQLVRGLALADWYQCGAGRAISPALKGKGYRTGEISEPGTVSSTFAGTSCRGSPISVRSSTTTAPCVPAWYGLLIGPWRPLAQRRNTQTR